MTLKILLPTAFALALAACSPTPQTESPQSVAEVKTNVVASTGYDPGTLVLAAGPAQLTVTVVNSPLVSRSSLERQGDAQRIVSAVENAIKDRAEFGGVHTVHVDYVTQNPDGGGRRRIDGFDFRKTPQGVFEHHIT